MKNLPPKYPLVWDEKNPQSVIQAINENFLSILSNTTVVTTFDPIAWSDAGRERQLHLRGNTDGVVDTRDNGAILTIGASYDGVEKGYDVRGLTFPDGAHALTITDHVGIFSGGTPGQLQVNLSYPTMTAETSIDSADLVAIYDSSAAAHRKITRANFVSGLASSVHTHPASDITSGQLALARGGTAADLSATGGTGQFLRQSSAGAAITVSAIAHADLGSGGGTGSKYLRDDMSWQSTGDFQAYDAGLTSLAALPTVADRVAYSTAADTWAETPLTSFGRSLIDDADAATGRNTLGASGGVWSLAVGGTAADLSATGGTGQFLRQSSAGAAITVSAIGHADLGSGGGSGSKYLRDDMTWQTVSAGVTDHGALTGLGDDDHTQYALLLGRSGGQTLIGGTAATDGLTLKDTSDAGTKASITLTVATGARLKYSTNEWVAGVSNLFGLIGGSTILTVGATSTFAGRLVAQGSGTSGYLDSGGTGGACYAGYGSAVGLGWYTAWGASAIYTGNAGSWLDNRSSSGLGIGLGASAAARALEVRSTSAQQRWSYDATHYAEIAVDSAGHVKISHNGSSFGIGNATTISGTNSNAIGYQAIASSSEAIAIGTLSVASTSAGSIAIGRSTNSTGGGVALGHAAAATSGAGSVAIGMQAAASGASANSIAAGYQAAASGTEAIAIGTLSVASAQGGIALGRQASAANNFAIALGYGATSTAANQFVVGSGTGPSTDWYGGKGVTHATPTAWTLNGTGGSGTDISGANLVLAPGKPTGAGSPGNLLIQFAPAGASGTTLRTLATYADWRIGGLMIGTSGAAARMLEVRSTSAQQRWSYDGTYYGEMAIASTGNATFSANGPITLTIGNTYASPGSGPRTLSISLAATYAANTSVANHAIESTLTLGSAFDYTAQRNSSVRALVDCSLSAGTVTHASGVSCLTTHSGAGTVTSLRGIVGQLAITGTGGGSSAISLSCMTPTATGSGTYTLGVGLDVANHSIARFTTAYGIRIQDQSSSAGTTWAFASMGTDDDSFFGGSLMIGAALTAPARKLEVRSTSAQQRWSYDASNYAEITVSSAGAVTLTATGASDGFCIGDSGDNIGFYGVTTVARPTAYTQTYSTADRTLSAYTADNESAAYTGIDNAQVGTVYAQLTDLNALRTAYENLRAFVEDIAQMLNSVTDDLQAVGLLQ